MKRTMLYFGSFNPIHKGHVALAEHVLDKGLCDNVALIVSPHNPTKDEGSLLPEFTRFEMAEIACKESRYPADIQPSAVEFLLPRPSYTINTLRFLQENNGRDTSFSILMGADNIEIFHKWREHEAILAEYPIYVYPRTGYTADKYSEIVHFLADAPTFDCSSTDIRRTLKEGGDASSMLPAGVLDYIKKNRLFATENRSELSALKAEGVEHFRHNEWGNALNAFRKALSIDAGDTESREYVKMIEEILEFRYKDIYNP